MLSFSSSNRHPSLFYGHNAADAIGMTTGKIEVSLETVEGLPETMPLSGDADGDYLKISITDNGGGSFANTF